MPVLPRRTTPQQPQSRPATVHAQPGDGPDAPVLLHPALSSALAGMAGRHILDVGSRVGCWTTHPVVRHPHPTDLPWPAAYFDAVVSIDVSGVLTAGQLDDHLAAASRVVREGGIMLCSVTDSATDVFTTVDTDPATAAKQLNQALARASTEGQIGAAMLSVPGVLRATAIRRKGRARLLEPDDDPDAGELAWRRLPTTVVRHRLHEVEEVVARARRRRWRPVAVERRTDPLAGTSGSALGETYLTRTPFAVIHLIRV